MAERWVCSKEAIRLDFGRGFLPNEQRMTSYKIEQRHLAYRGREFHFVSYDGTLANPAKQEPATVATWFLMSAGKRWAVMPHQRGQDEAEVDRLLTQWLEKHVFT
jgi:hypothetical protein